MPRSSKEVISLFGNKPERKSNQRELRTHLDGVAILGELQNHLKAIDEIDQELQDSIRDFERTTIDQETGEERVEFYRSTVLDKETIAVYHTRQNGRKMQIDTIMKMLNKVMPVLKAVEAIGDSRNKAEQALAAFAAAAASD